MAELLADDDAARSSSDAPQQPPAPAHAFSSRLQRITGASRLRPPAALGRPRPRARTRALCAEQPPPGAQRTRRCGVCWQGV